MQFVLKTGASKKEMKAIDEKLFRKESLSGFNAKNYNGSLKLKIDPLKIQLKLRTEWEK